MSYVFFLDRSLGKGMRGTAIADALVQALPAMAKLLETRRRPFVAKVSRGGTVTLLPH